MDKHKRLKEARKRAKLSQAKLASIAGIAQAQISRMERGEMWATNETIAKVAGAVGMPVADLLDVDGLAKSDDSLIPPMDSPKMIKANKLLPDGLRKLAGDKQVITALEIGPDEWIALASVQLPTPVDKSGYIACLLYTSPSPRDRG